MTSKIEDEIYDWRDVPEEIVKVINPKTNDSDLIAYLDTWENMDEEQRLDQLKFLIRWEKNDIAVDTRQETLAEVEKMIDEQHKFIDTDETLKERDKTNRHWSLQHLQSKLKELK